MIYHIWKTSQPFGDNPPRTTYCLRNKTHPTRKTIHLSQTLIDSIFPDLNLNLIPLAPNFTTFYLTYKLKGDK